MTPPPLTQFSKFNNFLWVSQFLCKTLYPPIENSTTRIAINAGGGGRLTQCYTFDKSSNSWSLLANMAVGREAPGGALLNGKLWVTGKDLHPLNF